MFKAGEVWFAEFPFEEDPSSFSNRPVVVLDEDTLGVLSVKVTKHKPRQSDPYDVPIVHWSEAGLDFVSTARISKVILLQPDDFIFKIGDLIPEDLTMIEQKYIEYINDQKQKTSLH